MTFESTMTRRRKSLWQSVDGSGFFPHPLFAVEAVRVSTTTEHPIYLKLPLAAQSVHSLSLLFLQCILIYTPKTIGVCALTQRYLLCQKSILTSRPRLRRSNGCPRRMSRPRLPTQSSGQLQWRQAGGQQVPASGAA